jgi:putative hemolysin
VTRNIFSIVKLTSEHQSQLVQFLSAAKQQAEHEVAETRTKLATARAQRDEQRAAADELRARLDATHLQLKKVGYTSQVKLKMKIFAQSKTQTVRL